MSFGINPHPGNGPATARYQNQQLVQSAANKKQILREAYARELLGLVDEIDALSGPEIMGFLLRHSQDERIRIMAHESALRGAQHDKPTVTIIENRDLLEQQCRAFGDRMRAKHSEELAMDILQDFGECFQMVAQGYREGD